MKYFTKELWQAYQTKNWKQADKEWLKRRWLYCVQLNKLKRRLSHSARRFFSKVSLHDGTLVSCSMGDLQHRRVAKAACNYGYAKTRATVRICVLDFDKPKIHILTYDGIRRLKVDYSSVSRLFVRGGEHCFDDWGYDELSSAGKKHLRHEILFASGATILIEFRSLAYRAERIGNG